MDVHIQVLGPVRAWLDAEPVDLGPAGQRAVLGLLALAGGRPQSRAELFEAIWGERPPPTATNMIQTRIKHLRRLLEPGRRRYERSGVLPAIGDGYALRVLDADVDLVRFRRLVAAAAEARQQGDAGRVAQILGDALRLWQGPPLADVPFLAAHPKVTALVEQHRTALGHYGDALIATGAADEALPALEEAAATHPLDEGAWARLIRAYRAAGRRAQAFDAYHETRRRLAAELGVDPGPELAAAHAALLHDGGPVTGAPPSGSLHDDAHATGAPPSGSLHDGGPATGAPRADPGEPPTPTSSGPLATVAGPRAEAGPRGAAGLPTSTAPPAAARSPVRRPVPAQLPMETATFVGRSRQLQELDELLQGAGGARTPAVALATLSGTAGVGKTALAVHWAHRVRHEFADGQLYVNLRGFDPAETALSPTEVMHDFLDAFGVPAHHLPTSPQALAGLYRSVLAERRVLVVLDNARDADQVRPLLPGASGCLALVTSRDRLGSLVAVEGARPIALDVLPDPEARQLLHRRIGTHRAGAEPAAVDQIVVLCTRLPLALAIVAGRAATDPRVPLATLARQLREAHTALDALTGEDQCTDVRAVFSWSYRALRGPAARMFHLLGLHPGPDLAPPAAASLAGIPTEAARSLLDELTRAHLVTERSAGRYGMHDLLRAYAGELAGAREPAAEQRAALGRLLDHYLRTAHAAALLLGPHQDRLPLPPAQPGVATQELADYPAALDWFTTEHAVLLAAVDRAADAGFAAHAWQLAAALEDFLNRRGHWRDWAATQRVALATGRRLADLGVQARAERGLARAYTRLGRFDDAVTHFQLARDIFARLGDDVGVANIHLGHSYACVGKGEHGPALHHARQALDRFRAAGDRRGQATALTMIGSYHARLGDHRPALAYCQRALGLHQSIGDRHGEANTWDSLGHVHHSLGHYHQATTCYQEALSRYQQLGDHYYAADTLAKLGESRLSLGDLAGARSAWQRALHALDELGHPSFVDCDADEVRRRLRLIDQLVDVDPGDRRP